MATGRIPGVVVRGDGADFWDTGLEDEVMLDSLACGACPGLLPAAFFGDGSSVLGSLALGLA